MHPDYPDNSTSYTWAPVQPQRTSLSRYALHIALFLVTFFTTTLAGVQWLNRDPLELSNFTLGLPYSISLLLILGSHEFGHYFAARYYSIRATLPFFIPIPPMFLNPFGTMGAVIRIKSPISTKKQLFDIGSAGPIAGLIVTILVLFYGILTLPPKEYLYIIHPDYAGLPKIPEGGLTFGHSIFFWGCLKFFGHGHFVPPMNEIYHYPYLCVGWFGLFITAMNLIPVGQLDGGHILYALAGKLQGKIAKVFFALLIVIGLISLVPFFGFPVEPGTTGWLLFAAILFFIIKLDHPEIYDPEPLDPNRTLIGWSLMLIFLLIFSPVPFFEFTPK